MDREELLKILIDNSSLKKREAQNILETLTDKELEFIQEDSASYFTDHIIQAAKDKQNHIMSLAENHRYEKPDMTEQWIRENFHLLPDLSDSEGKVYARRFTVYRWDAFVTLEGEIRAYYPEKYVDVQCFDAGTSRPYAAFYYCEFGDYERLLKEVDKKIERELQKIGVLSKTQRKRKPRQFKVEKKMYYQMDPQEE